MLPVCSAAGDVGRTLFVLKTSQMHWRKLDGADEKVRETLATHLPHNAFIHLHDDIASVISVSFYEFAVKFIQHISNPTTNGRRVLLTLNAYT